MTIQSGLDPNEEKIQSFELPYNIRNVIESNAKPSAPVSIDVKIYDKQGNVMAEDLQIN